MMVFRTIGLTMMILLLFSCHGKQGTMKQENQAQVADTGKPAIEFSSYEHDFGNMVEGDVVSHTFTFTNTGTGRLVIHSASASCGCTIPKYDKTPLPPGDTGKIEVVFNSAGKMGQQRKTIAIRANTDPPVTLLTIHANVKTDEK